MPLPEMPRHPSSRAFADALTQHRQRRELTIDELSYIVTDLGYPVSSSDIRALEHGTRPASVDDLIAFSHALNVSPGEMLAHIPIEMPDPIEHPLGTTLPTDVDQPEMRAWISGETSLERPARAKWWLDRCTRLAIAATHFDEQLQAAKVELHELGEASAREQVAPQLVAVLDRIKQLEYELQQTDMALMIAQQRAECLTRGN